MCIGAQQHYEKVNRMLNVLRDHEGRSQPRKLTRYLQAGDCMAIPAQYFVRMVFKNLSDYVHGVEGGVNDV